MAETLDGALAGPAIGAAAGSATPPGRLVHVIGLADDSLDRLPAAAFEALATAEVVVGARRHLARWRAQFGPDRQGQSHRPEPSGRTGDDGRHPELIEVTGAIPELAAAIRRRAVEQGKAVCVLASGDPGFFGIVRSVLGTIDRRLLRVVPAPSSVSLAFAALGLPWDDAVVVSAHGRPLTEAIGAVRSAPKAAVLTSPDSPPEAVGRALCEERVTLDLVAVCSELGSPDQQVTELSLEALSAGTFPPLSVVVLIGPGGLPVSGWGGARPGTAAGTPPTLAWGLPDERFAHRAGMLTKAEVRSVVLGKLALPHRGIVWDIGAGSASVALECAAVRPALTVLAVEQHEEDAARANANALDLRLPLHVVTGHAPEVLAQLPAPDRAFVGGGGLAVLEAVLARLRPGGRVVATFAALDRAAAAADRLGNLVQVGVSEGRRLDDGGWRLEARNPVFVAWGPAWPAGAR